MMKKLHLAIFAFSLFIAIAPVVHADTALYSFTNADTPHKYNEDRYAEVLSAGLYGVVVSADATSLSSVTVAISPENEAEDNARLSIKCYTGGSDCDGWATINGEGGALTNMLPVSGALPTPHPFTVSTPAVHAGDVLQIKINIVNDNVMVMTTADFSSTYVVVYGISAPAASVSFDVFGSTAAATGLVASAATAGQDTFANAWPLVAMTIGVPLAFYVAMRLFAVMPNRRARRKR